MADENVHVRRVAPDDDVDSQLLLIHEIAAAPGDPPVVTEAASALESVKDSIRGFNASEKKTREDPLLSFAGKLESIRSAANQALQTVASAEQVVVRAKTDLDTRRRSILPETVVERAKTLDGGDAAKVVRRELRSTETRAHVRSLDDMNRVQFIRVLTGEAKDAAFDALVAIVSAPVPIKLPSGAIEELTRKWFERWEPERTSAIAGVERAAAILEAATTRSRRFLSRRVEAMEAAAARRGRPPRSRPAPVAN